MEDMVKENRKVRKGTQSAQRINSVLISLCELCATLRTLRRIDGIGLQAGFQQSQDGGFFAIEFCCGADLLRAFRERFEQCAVEIAIQDGRMNVALAADG